MATNHQKTEIMRIFIILAIILAVVSLAAFKIINYFSPTYQKEHIEEVSKIDGITDTDTQNFPPKSQTTNQATIAKSYKPTQIQKIGVYKFKNRQAPPIPQLFKSTDSGIDVDRDESSNTWVFLGDPASVAQLIDIAESIDTEQLEFDLDFCLVMLNRDKLKERGLSIFYQEDASWLSMLSLRANGGSLRLAAGEFAIDFNYSNNSDSVAVVSVPSIRCLDGNPWRFETKTEVPVPRSDISDGTVRQSIEYRAVGFGLDGVARVHGDNGLILDIKQNNGAVTNKQLAGNDVPEFQVQTLQTSVKMSFSEWSVLGGLNVEKEELRKGIFSKSHTTSADYLVIFVRPRISLTAPPRAVPIPAAGDEHPLLPPKPQKGFTGYEVPTLPDLPER